jgi:putative endonuclease
MQSKEWCVYLLECCDGSYYVGITKDIEKRMTAHKSGRGSKYVRSRGFSHLKYSKNFLTKSNALKAEYTIKQLSREEKLKFFIR